MFPFSHFMPSFLLYATGGSGEKPPKKKWPRIVALVIVLAVVLTFFLSLAFEKDSDASINVHYAWVDPNADMLTLYTKYDSGRTPFEFGRDTIVARDKEFTEVLPLKERKTEDEYYVYVYDYEFDEEALAGSVTLHIRPPILFTQTEIMPVSVPAAVGETAKLCIDKPLRSSAKDVEAGESWFTVKSVEIEAAEAGSYTAKITLDTQAKHLPRLPKLVSGGTSFDGTATPYYDANDHLDSVEILFTLPADSEDAAAAFVEAATLDVSSALTQVTADDMSITDNLGTWTSATEQGTRKLSFAISKV